METKRGDAELNREFKKDVIPPKMTWEVLQEYLKNFDYSQVNEDNFTHFIVQLTDSFKGYPIDPEFKVFTGHQNVVGSSRVRDNEQHWIGEGIYMRPDDSVYIYLHELSHAQRGDHKVEQEGHFNYYKYLLTELEADTMAVDLYLKWEKCDKKVILECLQYKKSAIKMYLEEKCISNEQFKEVDDKYNQLIRRAQEV